MIIDKWGAYIFSCMAVAEDTLAFINRIYDWADANVINIITTALIIGVVLAIYRILGREIDRLRKS